MLTETENNTQNSNILDKFENFYFENYEFDLKTFKASFYYSFDKQENFVEEINFECGDFVRKGKLDIKIIKSLLFHLFISLGISYYKLYPNVKIILEKGSLNSEQIKFWRKFYVNGLGEYLYVNKLDPKIIFSEIIQKNTENIGVDTVDKIEKNNVYYEVGENYLIPIGGGKDSIVSIELIRQMGKNFDTFVFGKMDSIKQNCIKKIGAKNLFVGRKLSSNLFELNKKGYYNGHVPITGIITFVLEVVAYLYDYKYLVLSNEKSANFGNTKYMGMEINHQYSKSLEFEKDLKNYVEKYMNPKVKYFSLLRGMYEYKIAELFTKLGKNYFEVFSSCNNNFKILEKSPLSNFPPRGERITTKKNKTQKIWCNNCSKCGFVYSILSGFLSRQELDKIFKADLYANNELTQTFLELVGISGYKPLECVGESFEVIIGVKKYLENNSKNIKKSEFLEIFEQKVMGRLCEDFVKISKIKNNFNNCQEYLEKYFLDIEKKLLEISDEDLIPEDIKKELKKVL